jgi:hypothetical protein
MTPKQEAVFFEIHSGLGREAPGKRGHPGSSRLQAAEQLRTSRERLVGRVLHAGRTEAGGPARYRDDPEALQVPALEKEEIEMYRRYSDCYGEVFFIARRRD